MANYEYISLSREDENSIIDYYENNPTSGDLNFSLYRRPKFFDALDVEGDNSDIFVMRRIDTKEIICSFIISEKSCFINSEESRICYLSSLRLAKEHRNHLLGFYFKALNQHLIRKNLKIGLTSIFEDNELAKKNLLTGKGPLGMMKDLGLIHTIVFKPLIAKVKPMKNIKIRRSEPKDISSIVDFMRKLGISKTFFPLYKECHFNSDHGLLKNLKTEDIAVAIENDQIVGLMGIWDQKTFRYWKISNFSLRFKIIRPFINFYSWLNKKPQFPAAGEHLKYRNLTLVCIRNNDRALFYNLLNFQVRNLLHGNDIYLVYSMHESNPFLYYFPLPHVDLKSRLYLVFRKGCENLASDIKIDEVYIESGGL